MKSPRLRSAGPDKRICVSPSDLLNLNSVITLVLHNDGPDLMFTVSTGDKKLHWIFHKQNRSDVILS